MLNHFEGRQAKDADLTLHLSSPDLAAMLTRQESFEDAAQAGQVKTEGNPQALADLAGLLDSFDFWFNIVEP